MACSAVSGYKECSASSSCIGLVVLSLAVGNVAQAQAVGHAALSLAVGNVALAQAVGHVALSLG
jgi:hypothetical protein